VIPKAVDEYHQQLRAYPGQDAEKRSWRTRSGTSIMAAPESRMVVPFAMLLNLASVSGAQDKDALWGFIRRYAPDARPRRIPIWMRRPALP
jgi:lysyl-tRNA synthetase class 1